MSHLFSTIASLSSTIFASYDNYHLIHLLLSHPENRYNLCGEVQIQSSEMRLYNYISDEFGILKWETFIISQFLWVGKPGGDELGALAQVLSQVLSLQSGSQPGLEGLTGGQSASQLTQLAEAGFGSSWAVGLGDSFFTGIGPRHPSFPWHVGLSISSSQHGSWFPSGKANKRARLQDRRSQSLFVTILGVTSDFSCHIVFIRSESLALVYTQGEGITQGHEYWEEGIPGCHLGSCPL